MEIPERTANEQPPEYPSLSDADVSLIPKTITDNGNTLTLADVQWTSSEGLDGEGGIVTLFTATATYTGSVSSRYATGYTVTASYVGEVAKTDCQVVTYTAVFGSVEIPKESDTPEESDVPGESADPDGTSVTSIDWAGLKTPLLMVGLVLILIIGGGFALRRIRRR